MAEYRPAGNPAHVPRGSVLPRPVTESEVRALLAHSPLLDDGDYAHLTGQANADPGEGVEWLPSYKLALGLLMLGFGMLEAVAGLNTPPGTGADRRRMAVIRRARGLMHLSNVACAVGPTGSAEARARAEALNARIDAEFPLPFVVEG